MERDKVDLRECVEGDILISKHGYVFKYIRPTNEHEYLDHLVQYLKDDCFETRTHEGYFYRHQKLESDHDIIQIIQK